MLESAMEWVARALLASAVILQFVEGFSNKPKIRKIRLVIVGLIVASSLTIFVRVRPAKMWVELTLGGIWGIPSQVVQASTIFLSKT